jgi:small ligand-binding sensory domain FIST
VTRLKKGKRTCEEVNTLLRERALIEEEYSKKLMKLAKNFAPSEEVGTLGEALAGARLELEQNARVHLELANDMKQKLMIPLQEFIETQCAVRKNVIYN